MTNSTFLDGNRTNHSVHFRQGNFPGARYVSGHVVLDEAFRAGRLCTRYWSAAGQVWPEMHLDRLNWAQDQPADSFILEVNGQKLSGGYEWVDAQLTEDPSDYRNEGKTVTHGVITLAHPEREIEVKVHTRLDGSPFLLRWLEITNKSTKAMGITAVAPFAGMLWTHRADEHLPTPDDPPFEIAYNHLTNWGQEGDFWFDPLQEGVRIIDGGKRGRSGWGRPAFWARNRCNGQTFVCELAWGGNYAFSLDCRLRPTQNGGRVTVADRHAELFFRMGLSGHDDVLRVLLPGETISTPVVHLALFQADDDAIVQATHDHVRHVVLPAPVPGRYIEMEANHRGYLCDRENEPDIKRDVEIAAAIGTELYVIDAGWYGSEPNQWWNNVGDWQAGPWLPNGLEPVAEHARQLGMRFGLWVEIEAIGENSTLKKTHPEWLLTRDGQPIAHGRALDLSNPEVAAWIESELERIIRTYQLDMYRIDHNHSLAPSGNRPFAGFTEDLTWRYYESLYAIFDRLRAKFLDVVFQNCAGGGGRLDWGTMHRFHNTELSDWMRMPRSMKIMNGVSMSLPPEILLRTFGTETGEIELDGDLDSQLRLVCLTRLIFRGIAPSIAELSPYLAERIAHYLTMYRDFIRPLLPDCRVYHHTPFLPLTETTPWCVLEYASADRTRAVAGVFRTSDAGPVEWVFRPKGLDPAREYEVTLDSTGDIIRLSGWELAQTGIRVRLERTMSSELLLIRNV